MKYSNTDAEKLRQKLDNLEGTLLEEANKDERIVADEKAVHEPKTYTPHHDIPNGPPGLGVKVIRYLQAKGIVNATEHKK